MYTLFYSPGSCSLIIHALLEELGIPFELRPVDLQGGEHKGAAYRQVNPKGKVPALITPDGTLTECVALIEYLCERHGGRHLLGETASWKRARTLERIATLATEIHPLFGRFFHADDYSDDESVQAAVKAHGAAKLAKWFAEQDAAMDSDYWSGPELTAADFYFMMVVRWGRWLDPPATRMRNIEPVFTRMVTRPAVARAFEREGLRPFG